MLLLLCWMLALAGCREQSNQVTLDEIWQGPAAAEASFECPELSDQQYADRVLMASVFLGKGVDVDQVRSTLKLASRALASYGIRLEIDPLVQRVPKETLFTIDPTKLRRKIKKGASQAKLEGLLLQGIKVLLQTHCRPRIDRTHWIFLREIVPEKGIAARIAGNVVGIGLSPELVAAEKKAPRDESWVRAAGLGGEFTPTLILSTDALKRQKPVESALTIVHELGHAMGLSHTKGGPEDVMSKVLGDCLPVLTDDQRQAFERGTRSIEQ